MTAWSLAPLARQDLWEIHDYIAERSQRSAARYVDVIIGKFDMLATFPELGARCEELAPGLRYFTVRSHVIYYRLTANRVEVARILHGRQDTTDIF